MGEVGAATVHCLFICYLVFSTLLSCSLLSKSLLGHPTIRKVALLNILANFCLHFFVNCLSVEEADAMLKVDVRSILFIRAGSAYRMLADSSFILSRYGRTLRFARVGLYCCR